MKKKTEQELQSFTILCRSDDVEWALPRHPFEDLDVDLEKSPVGTFLFLERKLQEHQLGVTGRSSEGSITHGKVGEKTKL